MNNALAISNDAQVNLPHQAKTRSGVVFNPRQEVWSYADSLQTVRLDFRTLPVSDLMRHSIKSVLLWYAENLSPSYLVGRFHLLAKFLWFLYSPSIGSIVRITPEHILSYRGSLDARSEYLLGSLVSLFEKWYDMGLDGISSGVVALLDKMKFKGGPKGEAVLTWHIHKGPLTELEFEAVHNAINAAFEDHSITLHDYLLVWLVISLGQRPI